MDKISWKTDYSSGLIYLDNHRRNYLDIVNKLIEIHNSNSCIRQLPVIFHRLAFYVEDYFVKKEMAIRDAPGIHLSGYKTEHRRFTSEMIHFQKRFSQGDVDICREMIEFMTGWFLNYISMFGSEAADFLRSKGYE